jgi:multicomponent Na+:H+ antiporter subunit E
MRSTMFLSNVLLMLMWVILTGDSTFSNFAFGFIFSFLILRLISVDKKNGDYFKLVPKLIAFILFFIYELVVANVQAGYFIITPKSKLRPGIVGVPLDAKTDVEITFLTNLVSLTPGTLSVDVSSDRKVLYVHSIHIADREKFINNIKNGFEKRLLGILR